ncbi:hypothetical protein TNCT_178441 [Trichonephila clavata]|uniref:Uncharacterized protein n=1 Tax=Trichonephila clavata TaxID=2740835 RepID=A0A8X6LBG0_TRICU|nr:hypothetical protein TNCT_178441 [Trichonephila clavata]
MIGNRGDTKRTLIGSNVGNPSYLGGCTHPFESDNVGTLSESSECLHVSHSLKSATRSSGKVLLSSSPAKSIHVRKSGADDTTLSEGRGA